MVADIEQSPKCNYIRTSISCSIFIKKKFPTIFLFLIIDQKNKKNGFERKVDFRNGVKRL